MTWGLATTHRSQEAAGKRRTCRSDQADKSPCTIFEQLRTVLWRRQELARKASTFPDFIHCNQVKRRRHRQPLPETLKWYTSALRSRADTTLQRSRSRSPRRSRYDGRDRSRSPSRDRHRRDHRERSPANGHSSGQYDSTRAPPPPRSFEDRQQNKEQMMSSVRESSQQDRRVYVGNLSYDVKWHSLKDFMRKGKHRR